MSSRISLLVGIVLLALSGCAPKTDKALMLSDERIDDELQNLSSEFGGSTLEREWWKSYGDTQLDSIVSEALASAPSIRSIEARYVQADALIASVESYERPHLSAHSSLTRERFSANHIFPSTFLGGSANTEYQTGIALNYDFDFWNKRRSQILSAKEDALSERASIEAARLALSTGLVEVYLGWNYDERQLSVLREIERAAEKELTIIKKRHRLGLIDASELYGSQDALEQVRQKVRIQQRKIEGEKESICVLGGFLPSFAETLKTPKIVENVTVALPKEVMLHLLSHRPDVAVAKHTALGKSHRIEEAKAQFYPDISLSGLIGFVSFSGSKFLEYSSFQPSTGVALSLPLLDWGAREANLNNRVGDYNASVYDYNQAVIKAANEVTVLLKHSALIDEQLHHHDLEMEAKRADTAIRERKFSYALENKVPYLKTKQAELGGMFEEIGLKRERELIRISLIRSLGGGYGEGEKQ